MDAIDFVAIAIPSLRSLQVQAPSSHVRQVRSCPLAFSFLVMHRNIAFLETYGLLEAFLYKHSLVRRRNARSSGDEEGSAEHQRRVRSCGCALIFCTNATSGIMRRRRLMCESRVCPHPKGFADSKRGKHVRKGDIFSRGIMHLTNKKTALRRVPFCLIEWVRLPINRCLVPALRLQLS